MIGNRLEAADHSGFTNAYHIFRRPGTNHWLIWFGLPFFTMSPFWVKPPGGRPLPIITTATKQLTIDQKHQVGRTVKGVGFAGLAVW